MGEVKKLHNHPKTEITPPKEGWATHAGSRFWDASTISSANRLPAGVYTVSVSTRIGVYLDRMKVVKDNLLILPGMGADTILMEIDLFMKAKPKYTKRGLVHKRGIIMEGPPGSGKTSNTELLIEKFTEDFDGIVLLGQQVGYIGAGLGLIRKREPDRPIMVVIEDIDDMVRGGEGDLLNLLDGKHQVDGVVIVATTNHLEKLPPRIKNRPSRFDLVVKIDLPPPTARLQYILTREPDLDTDRAAKIVEKSEGYSLAHLKELLLLTEVFDMDIDRAFDRMNAIMQAKLLPEQAKMQVTGAAGDDDDEADAAEAAE